MKIVNVKMSMIELILNHRDTEDSEENREGVFYLEKRLAKNKNNCKSYESSEENWDCEGIFFN